MNDYDSFIVENRDKLIASGVPAKEASLKAMEMWKNK